jgi:hypothetical protein
LSDTSLEREIEAALAVDPSPDFVARVRMRVAAEPHPARRWMPWPWIAAAAAAAVLVIAVAATHLWRSNPVTAPQVVRTTEPAGGEQRPAGVSPIVEPPSVELPAVVRRGDAGRRTVRAAAVRQPSEPSTRPFPEVLISASETAALQKAFAILGGRPDAPRKLEDFPPPPPLEPVELPEVALAPVIIEPVPQLARLQ